MVKEVVRIIHRLEVPRDIRRRRLNDRRTIRRRNVRRTIRRLNDRLLNERRTTINTRVNVNFSAYY